MNDVAGPCNGTGPISAQVRCANTNAIRLIQREHSIATNSPQWSPPHELPPATVAVIAPAISSRSTLRNLHIFVRVAIGVSHRCGIGDEAAVDTVIVGVVGNDEHALFGLGAAAEKRGCESGCRGDTTHDFPQRNTIDGRR